MRGPWNGREVFSAYQAGVKESTRLKQQIKSMLNEHCVRLERGFRLSHPSAMERLGKLREWTPVQRMLLEQLHTGLVAARVRRQELRHYMAKEVLEEMELLRLALLCGLSLVTIYGLTAAIGNISRFSQSKKLVAYLGLNPSVCQSGDYEGGTALKRHGRGTLRALLVQSAKKLLQVNNPLQKWGLAVAARRGRNKATVAVARKLNLRRGLARHARSCHRSDRATSYEVTLDLTTCLHRLDDMEVVAGCGWLDLHPASMNKCLHTELSSLEGTRGQFNDRTSAIKLGIDVHQAFYVVVVQEGGSNPKPAQRMSRAAFLPWAAKLRQKHDATPLHAVYEACGFGFGLQRELTALGIRCHVVCPQKLDERNQRVKTDGRDAKALCQKLDRYVEGNRDALAVVRVPTPEEEQLRAVHRQREQLVRTRKQLEAHGRSLMVNTALTPSRSGGRRAPLANSKCRRS